MGARSTKGGSARLSPRELEVARMVAEGLTNREIGARLFISERTVDGHLEHIREKLGVNTRAQITAWVIRNEAIEIAAPAVPAAPVAVTRRRWTFTHPRAWLGGALVLAVLAAGVGVLRLTAPPPPSIQTVVGSDCLKPRYPGGCYEAGEQKALEAKLSRPTSVAVDSKGVIYFADYDNGRIRKVAGGFMSTIAGGGTKELVDGSYGLSVSSDSLGYASTVAVDSHDRLFVLTSRDDILEVWRIDADGFLHHFVTLPGPSREAVGFQAPNLPVGGMAITRDGVFYIADRAGNRVMRYDGGVPSLYAGSGDSIGEGGAATSAQLNWPIGLDLDRQENLYIADTGNHRVRRVDHGTGIITTVAGGQSEFEGDSGDESLATHARLSFPIGIVVAPDGTVVISDHGNQRLREITPDHVIHALAGTGRWGFAGDGMPALQAEFDGPEGLALDARGNLFIADTENQRIREIPGLFPA